MLLTEYDEAETMKLFQRDSYNQGKEDGYKLGKEEGYKLGEKLGKEEGKIDILVSLVKDAVITIPDAAKRLNLSEDEFQKLMSEHQS